MGRKRIIFIISWILFIGVLIGALIVSFFQLYKEAEKAQKTAFTGDVLTAGQDISKQIDELINSKYLSDSTILPINYSNTIKEKSLIITQNGKPKAIVSQFIDDYQGDIVVVKNDTVNFSKKDSSNIITLDTVVNDYSTYTDSIFCHIKMSELKKIIQKTLKEHNLNVDYDFAIFNLPANKFILKTTSETQDFLKKGYIFALHTNNSEAYTHYLILNFPTARTYFFQKMYAIVLPIIGILCLLSVLLLILIITINQQKHNHEITNAFINNITHEFKTPISTISLACEALQDETIQKDTETSRSFIAMIKDENWRLQKMVTNILDLAQLKRGQLKLHCEDVNIHNLLNKILRNFALQVSTRNGEIATCYNAENPFVYGDPAHLESILINLIENALKYCEQSPYIRISTSIEKNKIRIDIQDNGIGIAKKDLRHIFDQFFRVSKGNIHNTQGYGLGLNFVRKITQLHKGEITVHSEVGKGSTFSIFLPITNKTK